MIDKITSITQAELDTIDMSVFKGQTWLYLESGYEHYRLLAYISTLFNNKILLDIGTYKGDSSTALTYGKTNRVISFDINDSLENTNPKVEYNLGNILDFTDVVKSASFILLDTLHEGEFEMVFIDFLNRIKYKGLVMFDDIYLNEPMQKVWNSISKEKYDLTKVGHQTGTGLAVW